MKMTPFNWARLAITGLFGLSAVVSGVQYANAEGNLETHLMFVISTCLLLGRVLYCFVRGR